MTARVERLDVVGDPQAWRSIGLVVDESGRIPLIGTGLRIVRSRGNVRHGIVGWALSGVAATLDATSIDGLATTVVGESGPVFAAHDIAASALDHVVVLTHDLDRTTNAIAEATGCELKRVREVGRMRQGFHRIGRGGLIVEIVERADVPEGPATFWGLVLNVDDLDAACERIGTDRISDPKDAVQPGRRIATIRDDVGLGLPVALMTT